MTTTESVRLNGTNRCSSRLEVKFSESWSSVCEGELDQQVAGVACRELDCGVPSVPQGALYGEVEAPLWSREFQCDGNESHLLDSEWSNSTTSTCSPDKTVGLTCSDLVQPNISVSPIVGVSRAKQQGFRVLLGYSFTVACSTEPQYQGGSFLILFTSSDTAQNYTLRAINHSAHFLFPAARSAQRGDYTCVYHVNVFSYNCSSESRPLHLIVSASVTDLIIRCVVVLLILTVLTTILFFHFKAGGPWRTEESAEPPAADRTEREA